MANSKIIPAASSSDHQFNYRLSDNLVLNINDFFKDNNYRLLFDDNLSHEQRMLLMDRRHSLESDFIEFVKDRINHLILDDNIRKSYLDNVDKFSRGLMVVDRNTVVVSSNMFSDDTDDETAMLDDGRDDDSPVHDDNDDLEIVVMDQLELEHVVHFCRCSSDCYCLQCHPDSDVDDYDFDYD